MCFSFSFRSGYLTIVLIRSPIVGCEGTSVGHLYSHRRQPMNVLAKSFLGTRLFIKGNIMGHRGTTIFYRGSLLKHPCSRDVTIFPIGNKWNHPRGASVQVYLIACILILIRVIYLFISYLTIRPSY